MTALDSDSTIPYGGATVADRRPLLVAVTGATGAIYGLTLVRRALEAGVPVRLAFTKAAERVVAGETGKTASEWAERFGEIAERAAARPETNADKTQSRLVPAPSENAPRFALDSVEDIGAPGASGSFRTRGMVIAPCSMGTLGRIAAGISGNLIEREADVCLKERRPLILLARETPLSAIHLRNMLALTEAGAVIMPPVPAFYTRPDTVDDLVNHAVDRALDFLGLSSPHAFRWGENREGQGMRNPNND